MWKVGFHSNTVEFESEKLERGAGAHRLIVLEAKPERVPEGHDPVNCCVCICDWCPWMEHQHEIVQVVLQGCRNVPLDDPVQCLSEHVEDVGSRLEAKYECNIVIEAAAPLANQEVPVLWVDRDVPECILKIELGKQGARAQRCHQARRDD
ncbi:hypothetical protein DAEQUDRAFT_741565 [Daedalea quercina L-15889]|uniref:Uncharacterized protein n=1 Tax=Daedalea quercina L-15889 TaxID=1314783 RepID=A0A165L6R4_9APHY|nr:hypothetical protein DAEQUDRAFT_741565 [Daedalea quercina L-15889]